MTNRTLKSILILILFFEISALTNAQTEWAPIGAKWYYSYSNNITYPIPGGYFTYESVKDTLVNGKNCRKLDLRYYPKQKDSIYWGYDLMYSDSGRVYYFYKNKFLLLYDFNVKVGDSLNILLYNPNIPYIKALPDTHYVKYRVLETGTMVINNENLKYYILGLKKIDSLIEENKQLCFFSNRIIEKIGCLKFIYGELPSLDEVYPFYSKLRCYFDNTFQYHINNAIPCDTLETVINEKSVEKSDILVYPNPITYFLNIENNSHLKYNLQLYKINGQAVFSENNITGSIFKLNASNWECGVYFVQITSKSYSIVKKIIKN